LKRHWHIDYLHSIARVSAYCYLLIQKYKSNAIIRAPHMPIECLWSQVFEAIPGAVIPVKGFGASDCRSGCRAHLVAFHPTVQTPRPLLASPETIDLLAQKTDVPTNALVCANL
jgi:Uri superfamily endonuclease